MMGEHVQDLLLDLAYGELPPERAAQVEAHLATCDACRAERDDIERTRALVAPLRALEEPRPAFDEPILRSARAEAGLQADGTPGPTIEVSGSVKPLGLQAARVDPLAPGVRVARNETSPRSRWTKRIVLGASIAGAAAVALVVGTSLVQRPREVSTGVNVALKYRAPAVPPPVPQSGVVPGEPVDARTGSGGDLAEQRASSSARQQLPAAPGSAGIERSSEPNRSAAAPSKRDPPQPRPAAPTAHAAAPGSSQPPDALAASDADRSQAPLPGTRDGEPQSASRRKNLAVAGGRVPASPAAELPATRPAELSARPPAELSASPPAPAAKQLSAAPPGSAAGKVSAPPIPMADAKPAAPATAQGAAGQGTPDPDRLEDSAGVARRSGQYPRAAELYQLAAGVRRSKNDSARAAWDLAHAVECLAAASKLPEARNVRAELLRSYPSEEGPLHAADRALGYPVGSPR